MPAELPAPRDGPIRRVIATAALWLSIAAGVWTLALIVTGGIDAQIGGLKITSHDFRRTLLYGAVLLAAYILAGGDVQIVVRRFMWLAQAIGAAIPPLQRLWNWIRRVEDRVFAVLLALCVL